MSYFFKYYPRLVAIKILKLYQKILSFDHGILKIFAPLGRCCFRPTCSDYAIEAIKKYGIIKGGPKAIWRVLRCNPWSKGGWDPIKNSKS
ncbi:membrane protein insertion efficiency factor YidD [Candidatus Falkowbacteria bacterium CG11_big_fil_rev_8_21_14_0_20_39_10]|uniref:Putative membrane protein insertion efficiency factor n=1 Tax=Candidatus Falkowbacteria bacterium CG11_big_fil_rev_8_21_14_0_20_39_10 TaxID=1974570 RepID=A0A2M6K995_9BACT|nr:MAG: membrane protein insertion efficiency factor YidD [Candidatus Falkowbacteria bacterium CG11_big_fil_rev_8_21_14_0_20_39_10]